MRTRNLAGRNIAGVGLGDVSLERTSKRGRDPADAIRRVHEALELGLDVIDVAPEQDSERAVGETVRALRVRDRAIVTTRVPALAGRDLVASLPVRYLVERIEASLRATKLDVLPLVQLPLRAAWRGSSAWPELVGWCTRIIREGKVLSWAVRVSETSRDDMPAIPRTQRAPAGTPEKEAPAPRPAGSLIMLPDEAVLADPALAIAVELSRGTAPAEIADDAEVKHPAVGFFDEPWLTALAIDFAMCARDALALIAASKIPVLALHPLAGGALAGTLGPGSSLAPRDDRHALTPEQLEQIAVGVAKLASRVKREPLSARSCDAARAEIETTPRPPNVMVTTIAELALRYVIDRGTIPLPRIHTREALSELWAAGEAAPLPAPLIEKIDELLPQELDA